MEGMKQPSIDGLKTSTSFFNASPRNNHNYNRHTVRLMMCPSARKDLMTNNCFEKKGVPFDTMDAINKFHQGLRDSEVNYRVNNHKNPYMAGWISYPTKRIDR